MDAKFENYFKEFLNATEGKLRSGVGVIMSFFPFSSGAVIYVVMNKNNENKPEQRKKSEDISEALLRTKIYDNTTCAKIKGKTVQGTLYVIVSQWSYIMFKSNSETEWTASSASRDFRSIVIKTKEKYAK